MLAWIGQWLHEVVAVVLLAIIVELVLPNKKMLRYTRLVIGLILLLTLLNPVLKIFDKEMLVKLETSYASWEADLKAKPLQMEPLAEIQQKGNELALKRDQQSSQLVEHTLEDAMWKEVERQTNVSIERLDVELQWQKNVTGEEFPYIEQVIVTIQEPTLSDEALQMDEEVVDVMISIVDIQDIKIGTEADAASNAEKINDDEVYQQLFTTDAQLIASIISSGWNVAAGQIIVQARNM